MGEDEIVARIETDKVTVDILSTHAGVIKKFYAEEGDTVEVGADFLEIDTDAKAPEGGAAPAQAAPEPAAVSADTLCALSELKINYSRCPHTPLGRNSCSSNTRPRGT